jgi:6-pyruvoyltetrahydropterin/6-carboxytetrahydropterin synthase
VKARAVKTHEIQMAHRLVGNSDVCSRIHGHSYKFEIAVERFSHGIGERGMVMDFSDIKALFCGWLDDNWDHRLLLWEDDPLLEHDNLFQKIESCAPGSVVTLPGNPTAENMAEYLLTNIFPVLLEEKNIPVVVAGIRVYETSQCVVECMR